MNYESKRAEAVQLLMATDTQQAKLIKLYMGEIDRRQHGRTEYKPLLDNAEMDILYTTLTPAGKKKVAELLTKRNNVTRAASELEYMALLIRSKLHLIMERFTRWGDIEIMEAAINMALLAVPQPERYKRAGEIANRIDIYGCSQSVDRDGLLHISMEEATTQQDLTKELDMAREKLKSMLAGYKGCYQATLDYIKVNKLYMPVSMAIMREYESEVKDYCYNCGWGKYKQQPVSLQKISIDTIPTLQGLYGMAMDYDTVEMDKGGYDYMLATYFNKE